MRNIKFTYTKIAFLLGFVFTLMVSCERELSDETVFATLPNTAEVFTDTPVGMGSDFYFPFLGSKPEAWSVDNTEGYNSQASMRFDVPNATDPEGNYAGAIFRIDGAGRDLTGYTALTFWAKASQGVTIGEIGFGQDFGENKYQANVSNLNLNTNWVKYIIPIPDPSKLFNERGMFWYSAGTQNTGGYGYTFWVDELKFEKLGTIGQPQPAIMNGVDIQQDAYSGISLEVTGLTQTFNLGSGINQTVSAAPSYFDFESSDTGTATVNELGVINILGEGTPVITASLAGVEAAGSMTINILGDFELAPIPTRDPDDVTSIFSDSYTNIPVDFFNGYWEPYQTTESADFVIDGNHMLNYTSFNFVGNQFSSPTVDATQKSNVHINMYIPGEVPSNMDFLITIVDFGADQAQGGGDDSREQIFFDKSIWVANTWITLEFPITMTTRSNIGQIIYENINFSSLTNFYLDNIYFYK
ncbi:glycosyl hydrolase family 16 [Aestuariivivens sediminis]|uniref:glycosyl hydrolase family 16 n=1 Tax=Aestuariivivens sediminis TaxID=2913557 RepID=UPI001F59753A|nr:glycosyl hydrolase family 16 [Aestuariivivens sediminis]